jgi:C4-dicarboxylate-binding protein DctP
MIFCMASGEDLGRRCLQTLRTFGAALVLMLGFEPRLAARELRLTLQLAQQSLLYESVREFKERVERDAKQALTVSLFSDSQLYKAPEVRSAVGSGAIEMGASLLTEYSEVVPASRIFSLPFLFSNKALAAKASAAGSRVRHPIDEGIRVATGARVLWWVPGAAQVIIAKDRAIRAPRYIAGQKIRVFGASLPELVRLCGGEPLMVPGPEQYQLYQSRNADGGITSIDTVASRKLWEVANTAVLARQIHEVWVVLINEMVWRSLSEELRTIVTAAALEAENLAKVRIEALESQGLEKAAQHGMKMLTLTDREIEEWKSCSSPIGEEFLNRAGVPGETVMAAYRDILIH